MKLNEIFEGMYQVDKFNKRSYVEKNAVCPKCDERYDKSEGKMRMVDGKKQPVCPKCQ